MIASILSTSLGFAAGIAAAAGAVVAGFSCDFSCAVSLPPTQIVASAIRKIFATTRTLKFPPSNFFQSIESDFYVGAFFEMDGIDETHLAVVERKNHGLETNAFAEETDTAKKIAVGDTGASKD